MIQIALPTAVYLFQVFGLKRFPSSLLVILKSTQIIKIGCGVGNDLAKLARDFPDFKLPRKPKKKPYEFVVELGRLAKAKNAVTQATASLAQITAATLHCHLAKDIRATEWNAQQLTNEQIMYAALDAWVALEIWSVLRNTPSIGMPL